MILGRNILLKFFVFINYLRKNNSGKLIFNPQKLLVIQKAGLGDFLMLLPTLLTIVNTRKEIHIDLLITNDVKKIAERYEVFNSIRILENNSQSIYKRVKSLIREIVINIFTPYDILFQPCSGVNLVSYFLLVFTRSKMRIGFSYDGNFNFFDLCFDYNREQKDIMQNAKLLSYLAIDDEVINPHIPINSKEIDFAEMMIRESKQLVFGIISGNEKIIGIYPTTVEKNYKVTRNWGIYNFASFVDNLKDWNKDILFIFFGSTNDRDYCQQIINRTETNPCVLNFAGMANIFESCAVARHCNLVVGIDGGFMHFVNIMKISSIVIWGPTTYKNNGYNNKYTTNISQNANYLSSKEDKISQKDEDSKDLDIIELEDILKIAKIQLSESNYPNCTDKRK